MPEAQQDAIGVPIPVALTWAAYDITIHLRPTGALECVGVAVTARSEGGVVGSAAMRDLPVGRLIREARRLVLVSEMAHAEGALEEPRPSGVHVHLSANGVMSVETGQADDEFMRRKAAYWQSRADVIRQQLGSWSGDGNGRRYPDGHWEAVAQVVRDARERGDSPTEAVAEVFELSRGAAANQISRARGRGLLEPK